MMMMHFAPSDQLAALLAAGYETIEQVGQTLISHAHHVHGTSVGPTRNL